MVAFDTELLQADPASIALGSKTPDAQATDAPNEHGPACQAALSSYRTGLMFQVLFTCLVFAVSLAAAAALVYAIVTIIDDGVDLAVVVTGVSGVVGSGGAVFLGKKMAEATRVARTALGDVDKYCGTEVRNQLDAS